METLQHGKYYHIYNRGNNHEDLFRTPDNYQHFLHLYEKYIFPIADTYAWVLMKNHFHLLVRIKEEEEIEPVVETADRGQAHCQGKKTVTYPTPSMVSNPDSSSFNVKLPNLNRGSQTKKPNPTRQFSHLFNAYAQSFNKTFKRTGCLFETPFKRKLVDSDKYFRDLVVYIHSNPTHHQFTNDFKDYPWSSYGTIISVKPTKLNRNEVIGWFDDKANFIEVHKQKVNIELIKELIIE